MVPSPTRDGMPSPLRIADAAFPSRPRPAIGATGAPSRLSGSSMVSLSACVSISEVKVSSGFRDKD
eukprot:scaffold153345_cov37-Tisochrysis_lutea.AAC.3